MKEELKKATVVIYGRVFVAGGGPDNLEEIGSSIWSDYNSIEPKKGKHEFEKLIIGGDMTIEGDVWADELIFPDNVSVDFSCYSFSSGGNQIPKEEIGKWKEQWMKC